MDTDESICESIDTIADERDIDAILNDLITDDDKPECTNDMIFPAPSLDQVLTNIRTLVLSCSQTDYWRYLKHLSQLELSIRREQESPLSSNSSDNEDECQMRSLGQENLNDDSDGDCSSSDFENEVPMITTTSNPDYDDSASETEAEKEISEMVTNDNIEFVTADLVSEIKKDTLKLWNEKTCKDMKTLLKYDLVDWLKKRLVNLLQHVQELCNLVTHLSITFYWPK